MREDPQPDKPMHEKTFFGDNFVRKSGDYVAWQDLQVHALQSSEKGVDLNVMVSASWACERVRACMCQIMGVGVYVGVRALACHGAGVFVGAAVVGAGSRPRSMVCLQPVRGGRATPTPACGICAG